MIHLIDHETRGHRSKQFENNRGADYQGYNYLPVLREYMSELTGFPSRRVEGMTYDGDVLFVHGELSDYVTPKYHQDITRYFPNAQISELPGAGHWMHVEQPGQLLARIRAFLA